MRNERTALVTGSTSGIGLAIARRLATEGMRVVLTGLGEPATLRVLAEELSQTHSIEARYVCGDLAKPGEIRDLVAQAQAACGAIDILVNNAGIQYVAPVHEFPEDRWNEVMAVNLSAAFHTAKALVPSMRQRGWGRIINISSVHGLVASAEKCAYVAAKHGLLGLTKVLALENADFGITANAICPGWVRTELAEKQVRDRAQKEGMSLREAEVRLIGEKQPIEQFTTPEQIADLAVFLCSDSASTITGAALSMDGGWAAR